MEWFRLVCRVELDLVKGCQDFIIDWPPAIVLNSLVPALVLVIFWLIKSDIDGLFSRVFFYLVVVSRGEGINIANCSMDKNLIVDQGRKFQTSEPESNMGFRGWVQQMSFTSIDAFEELIGITLFLEINQIFVISVDPNICVGSPSPLDFLGGQLILGFQLHLLLTFKVASPGPLDLNGSDVVHGKPMILEESPGKGHLIGGLNEGGTEVPQALILIFVHDIEWGSQKLLPQVLSRCQVASNLANALVDEANIVGQLASPVGVLTVDHLLLKLELL
jgi:hypothetical protein